MNYYIKKSKTSEFKKVQITKDSENKPQKTETEVSEQEKLSLDTKYDLITSSLSDFDSIISFDVYDIDALSGILNYRDASGNHKQVRY